MGQIIIAVLLIYGAYVGWLNGFFKELASMVGFFVGLFIAWKCYEQLGGGVFVFLALWFAIPLVFSIIAHILTKAINVTKVTGFINHLLGMAVGVVKWMILICLAIRIIDKVEEWKTLLENL